MYEGPFLSDKSMFSPPQSGYPILRQSDFAKSKLRQKKWEHSFSPPLKCWRSLHLGEVRILTPKWFKKRFHTFLLLITMAVSKL